MTGTQVAIGIIAIVVTDIIILLILVNRRSTKSVEETEEDIMLSGEHIALGPESILFRKPMFRRFGVVGGNAVATLTDKRLIISPLVGSKTEIPLNEIVEVKQSNWYRGSYRGGLTNVILKLQDGREVSLLVKDPKPWLEGLGRR